MPLTRAWPFSLPSIPNPFVLLYQTLLSQLTTTLILSPQPLTSTTISLFHSLQHPESCSASHPKGNISGMTILWYATSNTSLSSLSFLGLSCFFSSYGSYVTLPDFRFSYQFYLGFNKMSFCCEFFCQKCF